MTFWWIRHDWLTYKTPDPLCKSVLASDMMEPDFQIEPSQLKFRFSRSKYDSAVAGDFAFWTGIGFFVSERGFKLLEPMFLRHGKAYPVLCGKLNYVIVTVDTVLDALDLKRSKYERLDLEEDVEEDIDRLLRVRLKENFTTDADIFRLKGILPVTMEIIVSDAFRRICLKNKLTGLMFRKAD